MLRAGIRRRGFTLLELLLVLVIVAVVLGLNAPVFKNNIAKTSFNSQLGKIYLFLDYAKTQAITREAIIKLEIDSENKKIALFKTGAGEGVELVSELKAGDSMDLGSSKDEVLFYPDGTTDEFEVYLSAGEGMQATIFIRGFDGKIEIKQNARE